MSFNRWSCNVYAAGESQQVLSPLARSVLGHRIKLLSCLSGRNAITHETSQSWIGDWAGGTKLQGGEEICLQSCLHLIFDVAWTTLREHAHRPNKANSQLGCSIHDPLPPSLMTREEYHDDKMSTRHIHLALMLCRIAWKVKRFTILSQESLFTHAYFEWVCLLISCSLLPRCGFPSERDGSKRWAQGRGNGERSMFRKMIMLPGCFFLNVQR